MCGIDHKYDCDTSYEKWEIISIPYVSITEPRSLVEKSVLGSGFS